MITRHALVYRTLAFLLIASTCSAGEFPDDYFFGQRPAGLMAIEGKPAPTLELDKWIGDETSLEKLRGQVVVIDFWATWCGPCMAAIPKNIKLVEDYKDKGMTFIGVHDSSNGWDKAAGVVQDKQINYPVARDKSGVSTKAYAVGFWPTYLVIDRKGVIRAAGLRPDKVEEVVKVLIEEPGGPAVSESSGEFPVDWYVGGDKRLPGLSAIEGQPAPAIQPSTENQVWIGTPQTIDDREGRITVLRFMAPDNRGTRNAMKEWRRTAESMSPHGIVFLGICDHFCDWSLMQNMFTEQKPPFPIVRDHSPESGSLPLGRTANSFGVRMWPTTIVIDRNGKVRAAGIKDGHLQAIIEKIIAEPGDQPDPAPTTGTGRS